MEKAQTKDHDQDGKDHLDRSMKGVCINYSFQSAADSVKNKNYAAYDYCNMVVNAKDQLQHISHPHDLSPRPDHIRH